MLKIKVLECPKCKREVEVQTSEQIPKKIKCPRCGHIYQIEKNVILGDSTQAKTDTWF